MIRAALFAACCLASVMPAFAGPPRPSGVAAPDCSGLAAARTQARAAAASLGYQVSDLDGPPARSLEADQDVPPTMMVDHLTVLTNPKTRQSVALMNDGPKCAFNSVGFVFAPHTPPIASALDLLRPIR